MHCPSCQYDNRSGVSFCEQCGAKLEMACPGCGAVGPPGRRFCGECGTALGDEPGTGVQGTPEREGAAAPERPPADRPEAERRQLTVMFCDLVGSTALSQTLDPEDLRELMRSYQAACKGAIERYEGFIARYMGDGVLAYFGYPRAHEDDAERSVRAGLELVDAVRAIETPSVAAGGVKLEVRVGIATGPVVVGDLIGEHASRENPVVGETPNLAARLQQAAAPGAVVVAPSTRRLLGERFEAEDLGEHALKGLTEPVRPWRIVSERSGESRFRAARGRFLTPLVGRDEEIAVLLRRWRRAKEGEGQVVTVSGEPGIGKSRIAETLCERLAGEPHVRLRYQCSPHHLNSVLHPVIAQLRHAAGLGARESASEQRGKLEALLRRAVPDVEEDLSVLSALLSIAPENDALPPADAQEKKSRTFAALMRQLEGLARASPVLCIFEDVHWIDPSTLELLERMVDRAPELPALIVVTCRPEFEPAWVGQAHTALVVLSRMGRREALALVAKVSGADRLPDAVVEDILAKSDGVPLFIEELTQSVLESVQGARDTGEDATSVARARSTVPTTLQDSLMARLDRLQSGRKLAQAGAAIGREFSIALVSRVCGLPGADVEPAIGELVGSGLAYRHGSGSEASCVFKHALVRDAAYETLLRDERRALHGRIAAALASEYPARVAESPELLAHHLGEAGEAEAALAQWVRAGRQSAGRAAHAEAIGHYLRALEALRSLPRREERLREEADLQIDLAQSMRVVEHHDEALDLLARAESVMAELDDPLALARLNHLRGNLYFPLGDAESCIAAHGKALAHARRAGSARAEANALTGLGDGEYSRGRMLSALGHFARGIALSREHGFDDIVAANLSMLGLGHFYANEFDEARSHMLEAVALSESAHQLRAEMNARVCLIHLLCDTGENALAREHASRIDVIVERLGAWSFQANNLSFLARAYRGDGERERALETARRSVEFARTGRLSFFGPRALGELAVCADDVGERERALAEGEALLREGAVGHNHLWFYRDAIDAMLEAGEWDRVERYADALADYTRAEPLPWSEFWIARGRALAAFGRGGRDDATIRALGTLREEAERVGLSAALPAIDAALS